MLYVNFENPDVIESIQDRVDSMVEDIGRLHVAVPDEMIVWQTEDMNRKFPNLEEAGGESYLKTWVTKIWPRSRMPDRRQHRPRRQRGRRVLFAPVGSKSGGRAILRPELFDALRLRMRALLDTISWKKK